MSATRKFTATTTVQTVSVSGRAYVIKNDGPDDVYWNSAGEPVGVAATDAPLKPGETISVNEGAQRISFKTASGTAVVRLFYLQ